MAFEALPDDLPGIPLLLREARGAFAGAIREAIRVAGLPEVPTNGPLILGGLHGGMSFTQLVNQRRKSIEKFQTVEKLRESGYLSESPDEPELSELGHEAAHVIFDAVSHLTDALHAHLGEEGTRSFVNGLLFLIAEKESHEESDGRPN